jgi:hypothetical protein
MPVLKKIIAKDDELNRVQDAIKVAYDPLVAVPFTKNQTVTVNFPVANTDVPIAHSLSSTPQGFVVLDITANAVIYRKAWDKSTITLRSTAIISGVKVMIF